MKIFGTQQVGLLSSGAIAILGVLVGSAAEPVQAQAVTPYLLAQQETPEPEDNCVALQEVTTGQTEIRKRIENRIITRGNWNTDFLVPNQNFDYFVAVITPENTAPYEFTANLRLPGGGSEPAFSGRSEVQAGSTYSIPFQSPTGRQPVVINARVGGVNGNFYTLSVVGCQTGSAGATSALTGTTWELQQIQFNDGRLITAASPQNYTLELTSAGEVFVRADCNQAIGGYTLAEDNRISMTLGPTTLAACPPNSNSNDFLQAIGNANQYFFQDGDLFIDLMFDSGTMQFSAANR